MKIIFILLFSGLLPSFCSAQIKNASVKKSPSTKPQPSRIELYNLIKNLVPDSAQVAKEVGWASLKSNPSLKLSTPNPESDKETKVYSLYTTTNIAMSGQNLGKWGVNFEGNATGYSQFSASPNVVDYTAYETTLKYLFGKNKVNGKVIKTCPRGDETVYEIKIDGKKTIWMDCYISGGTMGDALFINVYFLQKDVKTFFCDE